ncbi:uncharacterized protein F4822DRAFT_47768 [Hypoxylon trugodes]|uniref:uncharacterized protein n=1 Tax=Hypoxylon trugodes TaxID=326681 RepID=UPI00218D1670|nr:uncharacterized protein F4822DRAFT_47768 [Hypoxylon trugodes]KAI1394444.1 hypothetical protein F4822DRAFT_47768 [Hypoxylon trugodes]
MLAIVILIALLNFAEAAYLKTPRTASPPSPSLSLSSTTTLVAIPTATIASSGISPRPFLKSNSTVPQVAGTGVTKAETRSTALPLDAPTSVIHGSANNPEITPSPELNPPGGNFHEIGDSPIKYVQTTYWSCVEFPLETHCGWHEPILDAGAGGVRCDSGGRAALRAGVVAGVVAGGLALGL